MRVLSAVHSDSEFKSQFVSPIVRVDQNKKNQMIVFIDAKRNPSVVRFIWHPSTLEAEARWLKFQVHLRRVKGPSPLLKTYQIPPVPKHKIPPIPGLSLKSHQSPVWKSLESLSPIESPSPAQLPAASCQSRVSHPHAFFPKKSLVWGLLYGVTVWYSLVPCCQNTFPSDCNICIRETFPLRAEL